MPWIQVDPGSALSIIPKRLLYFLGILLIRLRCRIGDLKSEGTRYVIDADMLYNLLLGRPWIHANWIVPSTLHQCF